MLENLQTIAIFILFLGPLVFFHELGHFIFARLAGVRVETFSIGFGPKLFSYKYGDTVYAFSLIPLGGYVKMFGDDPLSEEELTDEQKEVAYTHKGKLARFSIVFGGPLANFILAFFIYLALVGIGENVPETRFGILPEESRFYDAGIRTGDVLKKINSQEIVSFDDLNLIDTNVTNITIRRGEELKTIAISQDGMSFIQDFAKFNNLFRAPVFVGSNKTQYLLFAENNNQIVSYEELESSNTQTFNLVPATEKADSSDRRFDVDNYNLNLQKSVKITRSSNGSLSEALRSQNIYPVDLFISSVSMDSPAEKAQLKRGDVITNINGKAINSFEELRSIVSTTKDEEAVQLKVFNNGQVRDLTLTPKLQEYNGQNIKIIGVVSNIKMLPVNMITVKTSGFFNILVKAYERTAEGMSKTLLGFKKLITGEVSLKNIGGPIAIGQVASDSFHISFAMFFRLMALISINLGIINLFPIPVLDGGHIVFIMLEAINRGPLSRKKMQYAQQVGMSLLFLLIFVAIFNDISRIFS